LTHWDAEEGFPTSFKRLTSPSVTLDQLKKRLSSDILPSYLYSLPLFGGRDDDYSYHSSMGVVQEVAERTPLSRCVYSTLASLPPDDTSITADATPSITLTNECTEDLFFGGDDRTLLSPLSSPQASPQLGPSMPIPSLDLDSDSLFALLYSSGTPNAATTSTSNGMNIKSISRNGGNIPRSISYPSARANASVSSSKSSNSSHKKGSSVSVSNGSGRSLMNGSSSTIRKSVSIPWLDQANDDDHDHDEVDDHDDDDDEHDNDNDIESDDDNNNDKNDKKATVKQGIVSVSRASNDSVSNVSAKSTNRSSLPSLPPSSSILTLTRTCTPTTARPKSSTARAPSSSSLAMNNARLSITANDTIDDSMLPFQFEDTPIPPSVSSSSSRSSAPTPSRAVRSYAAPSASTRAHHDTSLVDDHSQTKRSISSSYVHESDDDNDDDDTDNNDHEHNDEDDDDDDEDANDNIKLNDEEDDEQDDEDDNGDDDDDDDDDEPPMLVRSKHVAINVASKKAGGGSHKGNHNSKSNTSNSSSSGLSRSMEDEVAREMAHINGGFGTWRL
jgi:hypothetical protein